MCHIGWIWKEERKSREMGDAVGNGREKEERDKRERNGILEPMKTKSMSCLQMRGEGAEGHIG